MKIKVIDAFLLLLIAVVTQGKSAEGQRNITCGSVIQLRHLQSKKYFLKSSPSQRYHSGSGQQVVTLDVQGETLWQVRAAHNETCTTGEPITCGEVIRFTHIKTVKNLHSHHGVPAPLSPHNSEVSGFGDDGVGDSGDNWRVVCMKPKGTSDAKVWDSDRLVRFQHVDTRQHLSSSTKTKFTQANCPGCPLHGELEVSLTNRDSDYAIQSSIFVAGDDGVFFRR